MSSLGRLLRLRGLLEDVARGAVQVEARHAHLLEDALVAHRTMAADARRVGFKALVDGQTAPWLMAEASREIAGWQMKQLSPSIDRQQEKLALAQQDYLERRRDRQQVEAVLSAERAARELKLRRREQQAMDEWHAIRSAAQRREARRRSP